MNELYINAKYLPAACTRQQRLELLKNLASRKEPVPWYHGVTAKQLCMTKGNAEDLKKTSLRCMAMNPNGEWVIATIADGHEWAEGKKPSPVIMATMEGMVISCFIDAKEE